jgi:hypothetical protein
MRDGAFVVSGRELPASPPASGWASIFAVYAGTGDIPPLLGTYSAAVGTLTFRPKYPVAPGLRVRAVFRGREFVFNVPAGTVQPSTRVSEVYPTASAIPENQLKFYVEFSAPMSRGEAWKHLRLLKASGEAVELPFLEIDQEMWDLTSTRLTVLFDPGRIKRGVKPLEDIGPAIEAGGEYTLVVDAGWRDAAGAPLISGHSKRFRVVEADRTPIDPTAWRIAPVRAGTRDPLVVDFGEPLDWALAQRLIRVDGMAGAVSLESEERQWRFVPEAAWPTAGAVLNIDARLEDLAGNKVGRPLDVDVFERVSRTVSAEVVSIPVPVRRQ